MTTHVNRVTELAAWVGQSLGASGHRTVTQSMISAFADITDDHQWIHVDPERAKDSPFKSTVAHGYLTLSLVAPLVHEILTTDHQGFRLNYGLNRVRFPSPLFAESSIFADAFLTAYEEIPGGIQIILDITVHSSTSEKPVCVAQGVYRYYAEGLA